MTATSGLPDFFHNFHDQITTVIFTNNPVPRFSGNLVRFTRNERHRQRIVKLQIPTVSLDDPNDPILAISVPNQLFAGDVAIEGPQHSARINSDLIVRITQITTSQEYFDQKTSWHGRTNTRASCGRPCQHSCVGRQTICGELWLHQNRPSRRASTTRTSPS